MYREAQLKRLFALTVGRSQGRTGRDQGGGELRGHRARGHAGREAEAGVGGGAERGVAGARGGRGGVAAPRLPRARPARRPPRHRAGQLRQPLVSAPPLLTYRLL